MRLVFDSYWPQMAQQELGRVEDFHLEVNQHARARVSFGAGDTLLLAECKAAKPLPGHDDPLRRLYGQCLKAGLGPNGDGYIAVPRAELKQVFSSAIEVSAFVPPPEARQKRFDAAAAITTACKEADTLQVAMALLKTRGMYRRLTARQALEIDLQVAGTFLAVKTGMAVKLIKGG